MKTLKILIAIASFALAANSAWAHEEHEHPAGSGLFGLPPEYVHILINPMPVYGMSMGVLALSAALLLRNKPAQTIGIGLVILAAAFAWPVAYFGQNAYKSIRGQSDDAGQDALDEHMKRADKLVPIFYATAVFGVVALIGQRKFPKTATPLAAVTLATAIVSLGAGGWISKAGGQIRHSEFRHIGMPMDTDESHHETETNSPNTRK